MIGEKNKTKQKQPANCFFNFETQGNLSAF